MAKKAKAMATVTRRSVPTATLRKIDMGGGVFVYTNTAGAVVTIEYDNGDGTVRRVNLTT